MMKKLPEIELAGIVLEWNLQSDLGQRAHELAREILGQADPNGELQRWYYVARILEMEKDMPRLEDLKKSLLKMDPEELRAKIREIREDRIIRKDTKATKTKKAKTKDSAQTQLAKLLAGMSDEERDAFLQEIE